MAGRPGSVEELKALTGFSTERGEARGKALIARPTDVFISPFAKCGTTWMQQIVHGLRSNGAMAFEEITAVVPWLELAHDMGLDPDAPQVAEPRAFKSHLHWEEIPKGGRYIVVFRDPVDAMLSLFKVFEGWWFEEGAISVEEFTEYYLARHGHSYWDHAASWFRQRAREEILCVTFEEMKRDLPGIVARVAAHMGGYPPGVQEIATRQAGFEFMKKHGKQFDDHLVRQARDAHGSLPPGGSATKVSTGRIGADVPGRVRAALDARWRETMGAEFGLASYADLQAALRPRG